MGTFEKRAPGLKVTETVDGVDVIVIRRPLRGEGGGGLGWFASDVRWIYNLKFWCFEVWAPLVGLMTLPIGRMD